MTEDIDHLVSQFKEIEQALGEMVSGHSAYSQIQLISLDAQIVVAFDSIFAAIPQDERDRLTRIGFLVERLAKSNYSDELRTKISDKILEDATALANPIIVPSD